jgi:hypothetical protein
MGSTFSYRSARAGAMARHTLDFVAITALFGSRDSIVGVNGCIILKFFCYIACGKRRQGHEEHGGSGEHAGNYHDHPERNRRNNRVILDMGDRRIFTGDMIMYSTPSVAPNCPRFHASYKIFCKFRGGKCTLLPMPAGAHESNPH